MSPRGIDRRTAIVLLVVALTGCAETKFVPPTPEGRQHLGKIAAVALPTQSSRGLDKPVSGSGAGALMGAGEAAGSSLYIGAGAGCSTADAIACAVGLALGAAAAIVTAPVGAVVGAINAHSEEEVRAADSNLRAVLADGKISEELRNRVAAAAKARTAYDVAIASAATGSEKPRNLSAEGFGSVMEITITDLQLLSAGNIDPDVTLIIAAEARLKQTINGSELYRRKWAYTDVARNYFKMAAGNAAMLRAEIASGLDKLSDKIVTDFFISNSPELKETAARPGTVITIEAPTLHDPSAPQQPMPTIPAAAATTQQESALQPTPANLTDVPFKIDLQGQQYEGVGRLENGHFAGQIQYGNHTVVLVGDIKGDELSIRATGALNTKFSVYPGDNQCVAEGSTHPATGKVTIPMLASCGEVTPRVTLYLDLPAAAV